MNSIESFIEYGLRKNINPRFLAKISWGMNIFYIIGFFYGVLLGKIVFVYGTIMLSLGLFSSVILQVKRNDETVFGTVFGLGILSITSTVNFTLWAEILCQMLTSLIALKLLLAVLPIGMMLLLYFVTKRRIKTNAFKNSKNIKKSNIRLYSILGCVLGLSFGRLFLSRIQEESVLAITIICFAFLSLCYCLGTINILKLYYINKYNLQKYKHKKLFD